jgi:hypothetical protein
MFSTQALAEGFLVVSNMSDETEASPEISPKSSAEPAPRARKASSGSNLPDVRAEGEMGWGGGMDQLKA